MSSENNPVELDGKDLPACCPNPKMTLWSSHPRVYLDVTSTGQASCPYCGTKYKLKDGAKISTH
ncbi:MAG: zinc-finger domain-containing protein [Burkholderiaceae bacterium]